MTAIERKHMRVYLTTPELQTQAGAELFEMARRIAIDGTLDLSEVKELRRWLRANESNRAVAAIAYLHDIMTRITADNFVDRDELLELELAVERVIPASHRTPVIQARKKREAARHALLKEQCRVDAPNAEEQARPARLERQTPLQHSFTKVAGVSFANDDGTERQQIVARCQRGEQLLLRHDPENEYSAFAIEVRRLNGEQLGYAPEYFAVRVHDKHESGYNSTAYVTTITGGSSDKPTRGANLVVFFYARHVTRADLQSYVAYVMANLT